LLITPGSGFFFLWGEKKQFRIEEPLGVFKNSKNWKKDPWVSEWFFHYIIIKENSHLRIEASSLIC